MRTIQDVVSGTAVPKKHWADRHGKVLVLTAIALPTLFGMLGLVIDTGLLMTESRALQQVADAAATTAARQIALGNGTSAAVTAATSSVQQQGNLGDVTTTVHIPPSSGPYAGNSRCVEVVITRNVDTYFMQTLRDPTSSQVRVSAVAGVEEPGVGAAIVVLDPTPTAIAISSVPIALPALPPAHLGAMEVLGLGQLRVNGAVFVNSTWGGVDENGDPAGDGPGLPYGISCTPLLPLTKLVAPEIRVVGGVDNQQNYGNIQAGKKSPLQANKLSVPDPLRNLPVPTVDVDPINVSAQEWGTAQVLSLPLLSPPVTLRPGVYDWIQITAGRVIFEPGVYIIRKTHPLTGIGLSIIGGQVTADGVMFYVTDTATYSPASGSSPDAADGETPATQLNEMTLPPSICINAGLLGSRYSALNSPGSPFHGILIYQRRLSRRPIVLVAEQLLGGTALSGVVYAKWNRTVFVGHGTYDLRFAVGSLAVVNALQCNLSPSSLFPPVSEVFLLQ